MLPQLATPVLIDKQSEGVDENFIEALFRINKGSKVGE